MKQKRSIALLLAIFLLSSLIPTAFAAGYDGLALSAVGVVPQPISDSGIKTVMDSGVLPTFSAELTEQGVYGTLSHIPEGAEYISVLCSMGGLDYATFGYGWALTDTAEDTPPLQQLWLAADEHPVEAYQRKAVNKLFVKLKFLVNDEYIYTKPVVFSNDLNIPVPQTPPPFTASIGYSEYSGYYVEGKFTDIPANVVRIRPMYSLDGQEYQITKIGNDWELHALGTADEDEKAHMKNQMCLQKNDEPLKSYLANKLERFYIRLQITTDNGDTYDTQAALIERGAVQPYPEHKFATFADTMFAPCEEPSATRKVGQYQITVRENATIEEIQALLPKTLPVKVSFLQKDTSEFFTSGIVECKANWKELPKFNLKAGEDLIIPDAASLLTVPAGTVVTTPHGRYTLESSLAVGSAMTSGKVQLMLSVVGIDEKPDISLSDEIIRHFGTLALAFRQKPSGATSIKAYAFTEEDGERTEIGELLSLRDLNHNQWAPLYGYVPLLPLDETSSLSIVIEIKGGTFDGEKVTLQWPGEYDPPAEIQEDDSEGNKGDVGSDGGNNDNSSNNGGQRPNLPSGGENSSNSDSSNREVEVLLPVELEIKPPAPDTKAVDIPEAPPETPVIIQEVESTDSSSAPPTPDTSDTEDAQLTHALPKIEDVFVPLEPMSELETSGVSPIVPVAVTALLLGGLAVAVNASSVGGAGWLSWLKRVLRARL